MDEWLNEWNGFERIYRSNDLQHRSNIRPDSSRNRLYNENNCVIVRFSKTDANVLHVFLSSSRLLLLFFFDLLINFYHLNRTAHFHIQRRHFRLKLLACGAFFSCSSFIFLGEIFVYLIIVTQHNVITTANSVFDLVSIGASIFFLCKCIRLHVCVLLHFFVVYECMHIHDFLMFGIQL